MSQHGLDIYGSALIVKHEDVKRRPDVVRAYVEGTMEGLRYAHAHQEEALHILLKRKPELNRDLAQIQLKNALEEVFLPKESVESGYGYMMPQVIKRSVHITNEFFDVARPVAVHEVYTNEFIHK
jgi:NitT/TauT family transport system substrate-binding protein